MNLPNFPSTNVVPSDQPIPPLHDDMSKNGLNSDKKQNRFSLPEPPLVPPPPPSLEGDTNALLQLAIFNTMSDKVSMLNRYSMKSE